MRKAIIKIITLFVSLLILLSVSNMASAPEELRAQSLEEELQRIQEERED